MIGLPMLATRDGFGLDHANHVWLVCAQGKSICAHGWWRLARRALYLRDMARPESDPRGFASSFDSESLSIGDP